MMPFEYVRATDEGHATEASHPQDSHVLAGGTTLVDLMRLEVVRPKRVVDLNGLPLDQIEELPDGGLKLGALAKNSDVAAHAAVVARYPALAEALLAGASPQIRNMASVGGNLLQRTRCPYFRDLAFACNKRAPGTGCAALDGWARLHAVLGTSEHCIATHPSDMCVALVALDAVVHTRAPNGVVRAIAVADLHTLPGAHPEIENVLVPGELVTHVELPPRAFAARSRYVKVRDRASFAFALASAAVALELHGHTIREARIALGGVATKPWRASDAERVLVGRTATREAYELAAAAALQHARARPDNAFKLELARHTIIRALERAGGTA
jgi:xanthine dehydrogenase YagS FAD-binding subunit